MDEQAQQRDASQDSVARQHGEPCSSGRLEMLTSIFSKCLKHGLRQPGLQAMSTRFPGLPEPVVAALQDLYQQVLQHVEVHSQAEFADICQGHAIEDKLAELDAMQAKVPEISMSHEDATSAAQASAWLAAKEQEELYLQQQLEEAVTTRKKLQELVAQREALAQQLVGEYQAAINSVTRVLDCEAMPQAPHGAATAIVN